MEPKTTKQQILDLSDIVLDLLKSKKIDQIVKSGELLVKTLNLNNKIMIAGNGGSAAEAQHFSAELIGRFKTERRSLPSIALTTDTSILTAIGNDYGFEKIFSRQVEGIGNSGDILVVLSTSGNSGNLVEAVKVAREKKIKTIGLIGKSGGELKKLVDFPIVVESGDTARIQEIHLFIIHLWCDMVDASYNYEKKD